jgi:hypothetical protein
MSCPLFIRSAHRLRVVYRLVFALVVGLFTDLV